LKRFVTALFALTFLLCLSSAAAAPGSASDPLATKSYAEGTFASSAVSSGSDKADAALGGVYDSAAAALKSGYDAYAASAGTPAKAGYTFLDMPSGGAVKLGTGASFFLTSGGARVTVASGAVVNVSDGTEVASGTQLAKDTRYFCTESTSASFAATEPSAAGVEGAYAPSGGVGAAMTAYSDVTVSSWFYGAASYARSRALYPDSADAAFRPGEATGRAAIVYALWKAAGSPAASASAPFDDLTESWSFAPVAWAAENGIVEGYGGRLFGPSDTVSREQIAAIMYRYAKAVGRSVSQANDLSGYSDASVVADWALAPMRWANAAGLITGVTNTELVPRGTATRAQVAAILARFVGS